MRIVKVPKYKQLDEAVLVAENKENLRRGFDLSDLDDGDEDDNFSNPTQDLSNAVIYKEEIEESIKRFETAFQPISSTEPYKISEGSSPKLDVYKSIDLHSYNLTDNELRKFHFGEVHGQFNVSNNNLTSLKYFPKYIGGDCICSDNRIKDFSDNNITVLKGRFVGSRQKVKHGDMTDKAFRSQCLLCSIPQNENLVKTVSSSEYGELVSVNEKDNSCLVRLFSINAVRRFKTSDIECMEPIENLLD